MTRTRVALVAAAVLVAGAVAAAISSAFLTQDKNGRGLPPLTVRPAIASADTLKQPPPPPKGALVLAREAGVYAVALAVEPKRLTATVLSPSGGGASGLAVSFVVANRALPAGACGVGCYRVDTTHHVGTVRVRVAKKTAIFAIPKLSRPGQIFVRRATRTFSNLHSVVFREHLASGPTLAIDTLWQLESPNRMTYAIRGGSDAVVIGTRRWDRAKGGRWVKSTISPLELPAPPWGTRIVDAHVLSRDGDTIVVSWANPEIPAWFIGRFDAHTALPRTLSMTAAAHFMRHRYLSFNRPLVIHPPR